MGRTTPSDPSLSGRNSPSDQNDITFTPSEEENLTSPDQGTHNESTRVPIQTRAKTPGALNAPTHPEIEETRAQLSPPTGFAPQSTSTQIEPMMALNIKHLLDGVLSESDTESNTNPILSDHDKDVPKKLNPKLKEIEDAAMESIRINHHLKVCKEAIRPGQPRKGLTPAVKLTAYLGNSELNTKVGDELTKCGLNICGILKNHYAHHLGLSQENVKNLGAEATALADSTEDESYRETMIEKLKTSLLNIEQKCETEARLLNERATRKRTRDTANEEAGPLHKRPKQSHTNMVLNTTADRDVAINKLFEAVNDVSETRNMSEITNDKYYPTIDQSPAPTPTNDPKPRPRVYGTPNQGTRPRTTRPPTMARRMGQKPRQRRKQRKGTRPRTTRPPRPVRMVLRKDQRKDNKERNLEPQTNKQNILKILLTSLTIFLQLLNVVYYPKVYHSYLNLKT